MHSLEFTIMPLLIVEQHVCNRWGGEVSRKQGRVREEGEKGHLLDSEKWKKRKKIQYCIRKKESKEGASTRRKKKGEKEQGTCQVIQLRQGRTVSVG